MLIYTHTQQTNQRKMIRSPTRPTKVRAAPYLYTYTYPYLCLSTHTFVAVCVFLNTHTANFSFAV